MNETIRIGGAFFDDLAAAPDIKSTLMSDRRLTEDIFAAKHADTIRRHYTKMLHLEFLPEDAHFFASCIWRYLNSLDQPMTLESIRLTGRSARDWWNPPMARGLA